MTVSVQRSYLFLLGGAGAQLLAWLLIRPDRSGAEWAQSGAFALWLVVEAALAIAIGSLGRNHRTVLFAVLGGWGLQIVHFAAFGEHYGDALWAVGVFIQGFIAAIAVGVALLAWHLASRSRGNHRW